MKTIHFLPVILLSAGLILFYSCSDNVVNSGNTSADVNGTVLDQDGHAVYPVRVWLNHESYKDVNPDGTFSFNNVQYP